MAQTGMGTTIFSPTCVALFGQKRVAISGKAFIALPSSSCTKCSGDPNFLASYISLGYELDEFTLTYKSFSVSQSKHFRPGYPIWETK